MITKYPGFATQIAHPRHALCVFFDYSKFASLHETLWITLRSNVCPLDGVAGINIGKKGKAVLSKAKNLTASWGLNTKILADAGVGPHVKA